MTTSESRETLESSTVVAPHPRLSVNSLSSLYQSLDDDITMWRDLGVDHVGLISPKLEAAGWDASRRMLAEANLHVSNLAIEVRAIEESVEFAADVGAKALYLCSGGAASLTWDEAVGRFCDEVAPYIPRARELGVSLAVEPTNPLRADISFVFTLRDALDLARAAGIRVVLDFYSCWYERGLREVVRDNVDMVALVQVCDYAVGTFDTPNRVVPGDGDMPLERLVATMLEAGYDGAFDLEIIGPRIESEGYRSAVRRGVDRMSAILRSVGA